MATKRRTKEEKAFDERVSKIRSRGTNCIAIDIFKLIKVDEYARLTVQHQSHLSDEAMVAEVRKFALSEEIGGEESCV